MKPLEGTKPLDSIGLDSVRSGNGSLGAKLAGAASSLRGTDARLGDELGALRRGYLLRRLLLGADILALFGAYGAVAAAYSIAAADVTDAVGLVPYVLLLPIWVALAALSGLYHLSERRVDQSFADEVGPVTTVTTLWAWLMVVVDAAFSSGPTRLLGPVVIWIGAIIGVLCVRALVRRIARTTVWFRQPVLLIGGGDDVERVLRRIMRHPELGLDPIAAVRTQGSGFVLERLRPDGAEVMVDANGGAGVRPSPEDILELTTAAGIGRVIVAGWADSLSERTDLIRVLSAGDVCVDYVSGEPEALCSSAVLHHIEGLPILTIRPTTTRVTRAFKRGIDLLVAGLGLMLLSPVLAYVAIRIRIESPGPALFRHSRVGIGGVPFELLKFRTMVDGADELREQMRNSAGFPPMKMLKLRDDPRVTRFGAPLRRWSLDEVPQLWNVIKGEMSLVGPRPLPLDESQLAEGHFAERLRMRPGMTGPWQIHGRSDIPFDDMVKLDYMYVCSWTIREDLRLLARTLAAVVWGRGAY
jgi:exopolysaccharide biosynthesis polyprenyl glycosylphosphotransferase